MQAMANTSHTTWARAAVKTMLRRLLTRMANEAQKDAMAYRAALKEVR